MEPFAGSACVALHSGAEKFVLSDINPKLVDFYKRLRDNPTRLHKLYSSIPVDEQSYYQTRSAFNVARSSTKRAAQFLYLNRYCFNGIYRVNRKGEFNVPWGGGKTGKQLALTELQPFSEFLSYSSLICDDFENVIKAHLCASSFFYIDPPYARDEERVFREYHENSFSTKDWDRLVDCLDQIDAAGGRFLLSYAGDDELVCSLKHWANTHLDVTRNVGGFKSTRRKHREFIAMNYVPA